MKGSKAVLRNIIVLVVGVPTVVLVMTFASAYVYTRHALPDGAMPIASSARENSEAGQWIEWPDIPADIISAFVVAEDNRFFSHSGFDIALLFQEEEAQQDSSTVSMDVARRYSGLATGGVLQELLVLFVALEIESSMTKEEILTLYLNSVQLGPNTYGIADGAQYYFGVDIDEVSLGHAISLAAAARMPNDHNPHIRTETFLLHANAILARMQDAGYVTELQSRNARQEIPEVSSVIASRILPVAPTVGSDSADGTAAGQDGSAVVPAPSSQERVVLTTVDGAFVYHPLRVSSLNGFEVRNTTILETYFIPLTDESLQRSSAAGRTELQQQPEWYSKQLTLHIVIDVISRRSDSYTLFSLRSIDERNDGAAPPGTALVEFDRLGTVEIMGRGGFGSYSLGSYDIEVTFDPRQGVISIVVNGDVVAAEPLSRDLHSFGLMIAHDPNSVSIETFDLLAEQLKYIRRERGELFRPAESDRNPPGL